MTFEVQHLYAYSTMVIRWIFRVSVAINVEVVMYCPCAIAKIIIIGGTFKRRTRDRLNEPPLKALRLALFT